MNDKPKKRITEEEIDEVFNDVQNEADHKPKVDPARIEQDYTGDISGDPDDTTPEEAEAEIDRGKRREKAGTE